MTRVKDPAGALLGTVTVRVAEKSGVPELTVKTPFAPDGSAETERET
jgi:hypothetical protein